MTRSRRLQARGHLVEIGEARRHAGNELFARMEPFDRVETALRERLERHEPVADLPIRDCEDGVLRRIEDGVGVFFGLVGGGEDLVRRKDQAAEGGLFLDDTGVVLDVGRARYAIDERRDVGRPADLLEVARTAQLLFERDEIDGVAALGERDHLVEDASMGLAKEVAGVDDLRCEVERVVVQQDRAEHGPLRFEIVRKRALNDSDVGHVNASWATSLPSCLLSSPALPRPRL